MPGIVQLVSAISNEVVSTLATAGYAPLVAGKILLGRQSQDEETSPPRIIFIPVKSSFGPKSLANPSQVVGHPSTETRAQIRQRAIATENVTFEVRCWGVATSPGSDPDGADIDTTQALYHAVLLSTHLLTAGAYKIEGGGWVDAMRGGTQHLHLGREFVFGLTFATPVLDELLPVAGPSVSPNLSNTMIVPSGASGTGCG